MRTIEISEENLFQSQYTKGFKASILGRPKMSVVCGNCEGQYKTREYGPLGDRNDEMVSCCAFCGKWNLMGIFKV